MRLTAAEALAVAMIERVIQASVLAYGEEIPRQTATHLKGLAKAVRLYFECRQYGEASMCCNEIRRVVDPLGCRVVVIRVLDEWQPRLSAAAATYTKERA